MLWKAAPIRMPSGGVNKISHFACEFRDEIYLPVIAEGDPAPPDLLDVTQCRAPGPGGGGGYSDIFTHT